MATDVPNMLKIYYHTKFQNHQINDINVVSAQLLPQTLTVGEELYH
jgi:hypothetical protein